MIRLPAISPKALHDEPDRQFPRPHERRLVRSRHAWIQPPSGARLHAIRTRNQIRDLEERLARTIDQAEQSRLELAEARRKLTEAPQSPDELGERLSQILKLAHEEARANKEASENAASQTRDLAASEADRVVTNAREQADSIRSAAQEEAERPHPRRDRVGRAPAGAGRGRGRGEGRHRQRRGRGDVAGRSGPRPTGGSPPPRWRRRSWSATPTRCPSGP